MENGTFMERLQQMEEAGDKYRQMSTAGEMEHTAGDERDRKGIGGSII